MIRLKRESDKYLKGTKDSILQKAHRLELAGFSYANITLELTCHENAEKPGLRWPLTMALFEKIANYC